MLLPNLTLPVSDPIRDSMIRLLNQLVLDRIPPEQWKEVIHGNPYADCEIGPEFMGFLNIYWHLSQLIPTHWTLVDLGCSYNAQAFLLQDYRAVHSVDSFPGLVPFRAPNTTFYPMTIDRFLRDHAGSLDKDETFAICSYCPMWGERTTEHLRASFPNLFVYYPHGDHRRRPDCPTDTPRDRPGR
jgi:hypothetical protein